MISPINSNKRKKLPPKYLIKKVRIYNSVAKQQNKRYNEIYSAIKRINSKRK